MPEFNARIVQNRTINAKVTVTNGLIQVTPPLSLRSQTKNIVGLGDLDDVSITEPAEDGDLLQFNSTTNVWENNPNIDGGTF